ncbi:hypothetical protein WDU94_014504 [Cyamophila willieti]
MDTKIVLSSKELLVMDQTASTSKNVFLFKNNEEIPNVDFSESLLTNSEFGDYTEGVNLTWRELCVYAPQTKDRLFRTTKTSYKRIINNVTGAALSGTLVAIMGASGAGKSTLMSALSQRLPDDCIVDGDIRVNGKPVEPGNFRKACGFMYQQDLFSPCLTVFEHLYFMALLKLDRRIKAHQRIALIDSLLQELGLLASQNTRIGSTSASQQVVLSGGERKRLSFATELLTDPAILLCDEPTTGLDSFSASKLIRMMHDLTAQRKKTVLCTIHQPSSELIDLFDKIILLADSRTAFIGSTEAALAFLESQGYPCPYGYNPADFLIKSLAVTSDEISSRRRLKRICDEFSVSDFSKEMELEINYQTHVGTYDFLADFNSRKIKKPFWFTIMFVLIRRSFLNVVRDPTVQLSRILQKVAIAIMCSLCFAGSIDLTQRGVQSVQGALFIMVTENTFSPMYSVLSQFPDMLPLFQREYSAGLYSTFQFYVSYILSSLPGLIIEPVVFTIIMYWIAGLRDSFSVFLLAVLICILIINVATSCGLFFSLAFSSVGTAMACLVPFDYALMITSGVFYKLSSLPPYFSWIRYPLVG